ncbi:hypothetical protein V8F20_004016 [Naviculisporaceae sp. PSN 640]
MARLGNLPPELVLEILEHLSRKDQAAFARASKWTCSITDPFIYGRNKHHDNSSAIRTAIEKANIPALKKALLYDLDPNRREPGTQQTPLHQTTRCRPGYSGGRNPPSPETAKEMMQILLEAGADQNLKDKDHRTAFGIACFEENYGAALVLLDSQYSKIKLNQKDLNQTLHYAVQPLGNCVHAESCRYFDVLQDYKNNLTVYRANQRELLRRVLSMPGVDVNSRRNHPYQYRAQGTNFTPLHAALGPRHTGERGAIKPDIEVVKMLLEAGARPNATCCAKGYTPLGMVVRNLADGDWGAGFFSGLDPSNRVPTPEEVAEFTKLLILHGARLDVGGKRICPFSTALELAISSSSTNRQTQKRLNAPLRTMLDAKQPNNPVKRLVNQTFLDNIVDTVFESLLHFTERGLLFLGNGSNRRDLTSYANMLNVFRMLRDYGAQAWGLMHLGDDNNQTCTNYNVHPFLRRVASLATGAEWNYIWDGRAYRTLDEVLNELGI